MSGAVSAPGMRRWEGRELTRRLARWPVLESPRDLVRLTLLVMAACVLVSVCLGQDANWDLRNYHFYNGYAYLHGRLTQDLAAAQMQSYFVPMLDVGQYLLLRFSPPVVVGLLLGAWQGLLFLPLVAVAWEVLSGDARRRYLAPLLALAGLFSTAFLSELGNTMADNTTAVLVVGALALLLRGQRLQGEGAGHRLLFGVAGLLLGGAVAFKLTNAVYALGLAAAALSVGTTRQRATMLLWLAAPAVLACLALAGGWWWTLWRTYGNPLLPQFNAWFQAPLALPVSIVDTRWRPHGLLEQLAWPLVFTLHPGRVGELSFQQLAWGMLYLTGLGLLVRALVRRRRGERGVSSALWALVCCFLVSYGVWQLLFSIYRYLVVLEVLAPLLLWCGLTMLRPGRAGRWMAGLAVIACCCVALPALRGWVHAPWAAQAFRVQAPSMPDPRRSLVLLVGGEPQSWRIPLMPQAAAYASIGSNFPESPAYRARLAAMGQARPQRYAMLPAEGDRRLQRAEQVNGWADRLGMDGALGCRLLRRVAAKREGVEVLQGADGACRLKVAASPGGNAVREAETIAQAAKVLSRYGLSLDQSSCRIVDAWIGQAPFPYQWCSVVTAPSS